MEDYIDEELQIMDEQNTDISISADTFKKPIGSIDLPAAITIDKDQTIAKAIEVMKSNKMGSVIIVDGKEICGIFTERDVLMKVIGVISNLEKTSISDVMTHSPITLQAEDIVTHAMHNMHVGGFRHVPIVDESNTPLTMVSIKDLLTFILDHFPEEVTNTTSEPYRGPVSREGG